MRGAPWWLARPRLARQCFFKRGFRLFVARPGRPGPAGGGGGRPTGPATGFVQRLHPNCPGLSIKCVENTPQLLARFYRKRVAVLGRRDAQVALRSCYSTNKTLSTHIYPIVFYEDEFNLNSPSFYVWCAQRLHPECLRLATRCEQKPPARFS